MGRVPWVSMVKSAAWRNLETVHSSPTDSKVTSALVYSSGPSDISAAIIDGEVVMRDGRLLNLNERSVIEDANREASGLLERAGLSV